MKEEVELQIDDCICSRVHSVTRGRFECIDRLFEVPDRDEIES